VPRNVRHRDAGVSHAVRGTVTKEEVVWLQDWQDAAELRAALRAWQRRYNETRPHQALGWQTPAEYRTAKLAAPPVAA
jgi:transposase InsO family protein